MAFLFRLETADGVLAEPPTVTSAVPDFRAGHTIALDVGSFGAGKMGSAAALGLLPGPGAS